MQNIFFLNVLLIHEVHIVKGTHNSKVPVSFTNKQDSLNRLGSWRKGEGYHWWAWRGQVHALGLHSYIWKEKITKGKDWITSRYLPALHHSSLLIMFTQLMCFMNPTSRGTCRKRYTFQTSKFKLMSSHCLPGRFGDENENRERNEILLVLMLTQDSSFNEADLLS